MTQAFENRGPITFARAQNGRLQITPAALAAMSRHVQDRPGVPEAGGVLLGRHILNTDDIVVDSVTSPMPGDRRNRFRFVRSRRRHQAEIDRVWRESGGTSTYLGEWHTHPELHPRPSLTDRLNWQRKLLVDRFTDPIFFIIVGGAEICVWEGRHLGLATLLRQA